ncbi:hypothetical protein 16Q_139 [Pseudomonas phage 16Q]|nr:hypothetical protein 16Q_139 [Pseudomonas phage 16Q]
MTVKAGFAQDGSSTMTPALRAGIKVGTKVKMVNDFFAGSYGFSSGDIVTLKVDDGSAVPLFENALQSVEVWVPLSDVELLQPSAVGPKFPIGSDVLVIESGWGFGTEMIGRVLKVVDFNLRDGEATTYHLVDSEGQSHGRDIWEPCLELASVRPSIASLMPEAIVTVRSVMSVVQQQAFNCFTTMLRLAQLVAAGNEPGDELFYTGYGICDNISRCKTNDADSEQLSMIKDNLIRRLPSYSGNYHYPVSCPENPKNVDAADNAWSNHCNKWTGAYGSNRIKQLEELIHVIEHEWKEEYGKGMTPSQRVGLIEGVSVVKRTSNEKLYRFVRDDRSSDPYFESLTDGDQVCIDLRLITILAMEPVEGDTRSVADFLAAIEAEQKAKTEMERQIAELQQAVAKVGSTIAMLDYGLRINHRVQRLS